MVKKFSTIILVLAVVLTGIYLSRPKKNAQQNPNISPTDILTGEVKKPAGEMKITSVFGSNEEIPMKYSCKGENINPPLKFSGIPEGSKSLALIVDDPDAPAGTWTHWLLWNIDPEVGEIAENSVPRGAIQGKTSSGKNRYSGPCPPSGTHRYFFKLYALDTGLDLPSTTAKKELEDEMEKYILQQTELVGIYSKK